MDWTIARREVVHAAWLDHDQRLATSMVELPKIFEPLPRRSSRGVHDRFDSLLAPHEPGIMRT